tara:strand:+ start:2328 stop:3947 length:1620 start_codon:yes stop_codon:yes gene_type:complete
MNIRHCIVFNSNQEIKRRTSGAYRFANQLESMGWRVTVVDWAADWPEEDLRRYLDAIVSDDTVLFAISYTWMKPWWAQRFVEQLKEAYPGRKYMAGGQQFFQHDIGMDAMLFGYAEKAVPDTINWLFNDGPKPKGKDILGGLFIDCNTDYKAMNLGDYSIDYRDDDYVQDYEMLTVELSRGCKFRCKYCNYAFLGVKEDTSTEGELLRAELMDNYERFGTTNYILADDTLNDRESKLEMLGDVVQSLPFEPNFACFIRMDLTIAKPQQLKLLSKARVWNHFYGVETFNDEAGKAVAKGMPSKRIKQGMMDMREHMMGELGLYRGSCGMIAGLPHETPDSWQRSEDWLRENWGDQNWDWWPLEISLDTNTATTSVFSKEWRQHGYREITDPVRLAEIHSYYDREAGGTQHKFDNKSLYWEADWADIGQASKFVKEWQDSDFCRNDQLVSSFFLLNYLPFVKSYKELLELKLRPMIWNIHNGQQHNEIVVPYIRRKLKGIQSLEALKQNGAGQGFLDLARNQLFESCTHNRRLSSLWKTIN